MVPEKNMWNYNFVGLGLVPSMRYKLILSNPKEFYIGCPILSNLIGRMKMKIMILLILRMHFRDYLNKLIK